jgi:hypothetical protein
MSRKPPYYNEPVKVRLHQRIRNLDQLLSEPEETIKSGLSPAVKIILILAVIIFLFVCSIPVLVFVQLLFR